ncbi:hypothetical protein [Thermofilum sp.]|uniref:hypothetical protein n=1 Tax=Thermofilum sp. TaxID=1961369 RepID=UPI0031656ADA
MSVIEYNGRRYRVRELTFGEVVEYIESSMDNVATTSGDVKKVVNVAKANKTLLTLCVEVEDGGQMRRLTQEEVSKLPGRLGLKLVSECMRINDFLLQA